MSHSPSDSSGHSQNLANYGTEDRGNNPKGQRYTPVLSHSEERALKECGKESLYYRCIPLSFLFSGLAYIGMKNGYLMKSGNYGYTRKMILGAVIGYITGKLSYTRTCAEKIMKLPDSPLAERMRKMYGVKSISESQDFGSDFPREGAISMPDGDIPLSDDRRPDLSEHSEGIDSYNKVTEDLSPYTSGVEAKKKYTTYEDLRRENREQHSNKIAERNRSQTPGANLSPLSPTYSDPTNPPYFVPAYGDSSPPPSSSSSSSPSFGPPKGTPYFNPKKNKYGDVWDD